MRSAVSRHPDMAEIVGSPAEDIRRGVFYLQNATVHGIEPENGMLLFYVGRGGEFNVFSRFGIIIVNTAVHRKSWGIVIGKVLICHIQAGRVVTQSATQSSAPVMRLLIFNLIWLHVLSDSGMPPF